MVQARTILLALRVLPKLHLAKPWCVYEATLCLKPVVSQCCLPRFIMYCIFTSFICSLFYPVTVLMVFCICVLYCTYYSCFFLLLSKDMLVAWVCMVSIYKDLSGKIHDQIKFNVYYLCVVIEENKFPFFECFLWPKHHGMLFIQFQLS